MALLGFELLLRLFLGAFLNLLFVSRRETSEKFIRTGFRIGSGIAVCALSLLCFSGSPQISIWGIHILLPWFGLFLYTYVIRGPWRLLGVLLLVESLGYFGARDGLQGTVGFMGSILLLGAIYTGQFLGHWFLNVPGMNIRELKRIVKILIFALTVRTLTNLWALISYSIFEAAFDSQMLYGMRVLWGLLPLYVLAFMIYRTTIQRSTQSATGIYYAASVMVLVGEAVAIYLKLTLNWIV
jgi:hypothetical protein